MESVEFFPNMAQKTKKYNQGNLNKKQSNYFRTGKTWPNIERDEIKSRENSCDVSVMSAQNGKKKLTSVSNHLNDFAIFASVAKKICPPPKNQTSP